MKKFICVIFCLLSILINAASKIDRDMEIYSMKLGEVLNNISIMYGKTITADSDARNIVIDAFFPAGSSFKQILSSIARANNLNIDYADDSIFLTSNLESYDSSKQIRDFKIVGKICDEMTGRPIEGAKIEIKNGKRKSGYSDKNGNYIFSSLASDVYILNFEAKNYQSKGEIVSLNQKNKSVNIFLRPSDVIFDVDFSNNIMNSVDGENYSKTYSFKSSDAKEIKKIINELYGDKAKLSISEPKNTLLVIAMREVIEDIDYIIKNLDKDSKQVKIESEIVDVASNLFEDLGFDWAYGTNKTKNEDAFSLTLLKNVSNFSGTNLFSSGFNLVRQFASGGELLNFSFNFLEGNNDLSISSVPTITIESGQNGEFKVSEEIVVGEKVSRHKENEENKIISEPIFKEAGIIMKVRPVVTQNDEIILDINLEVSDFKFKANSNANDVNGGTVNSSGGSKIGRSVKTRVRVKNGETILIGGLKKSSNHNTESKVPIVGDVPLIGNLFKKRSKNSEKSDMYIKIKASIVD